MSPKRSPRKQRRMRISDSDEAPCGMAVDHGEDSGKTMLGEEMRAVVGVIHGRLKHLPP